MTRKIDAIRLIAFSGQLPFPQVAPGGLEPTFAATRVGVN